MPFLHLITICILSWQSFLSQNHMKFSGSPFAELNSMSPRSGPGGPHSPLYSHTLTNNLNSSQGNDVHKMQADIQAYKLKLEHWEQAYNQAKSVSGCVNQSISLHISV